MKDFDWVCNECGSHELSDTVPEQDLEYFSCSSCGCPDFHKEEKEDT